MRNSLCLLALAAVHVIYEQTLVNLHDLAALGYIDRANNGILYDRYALCDALDKFAAAVGIILRILHQQVDLELDEIHLMRINILLECGGAATLGKTVGILTVGQQQNLYVHTLGKQHIYTSQRGLDAGLIAVIEYRDIVGKPVYQTYLAWGERCAARCHYVLNPALEHAYHIGIALNQETAVLAYYGLLGLPESVEFTALGVDHALG